MRIAQILIVVSLEIGFLFVAAYLLNHSMGQMLKGLKVALKGEFRTDAGKLNLVGMLLLAFLYVFSDLHEAAINSLSVEKPAPQSSHLIGALVLFGLGFVFSLICVMVVERNSTDD